MTDRQNLEWIVYYNLSNNTINTKKGKELLGFETEEDLRSWYEIYRNEKVYWKFKKNVS